MPGIFCCCNLFDFYTFVTYPPVLINKFLISMKISGVDGHTLGRQLDVRQAQPPRAQVVGLAADSQRAIRVCGACGHRGLQEYMP